MKESGLSEREVLDYLESNPGFLENNEPLLNSIINNRPKDGTISLAQKQIQILHERNTEMRKKIALLVKRAKTNDEIFEKTRSLNLSVINSTSWSELNETLATQMIIDFDADFVSIHLKEIDTINGLDHIHFHDKKLPCEALLGNQVTQCSSVRAEEMESLFPIDQYNEAGSAVLLKMKLLRGGGLLCIGSNEPTMFSQEIDTMFVRYMADVLACVINRLIEL